MEQNTTFSFIALATQYSFWLAFSSMIAGIVYFHMERNNLTPRYSIIASLCAMIVTIAAVNYYSMKDIVGLDGQLSSLLNVPTQFRYVDWALTTPLIVAIFPLLTQSANRAGMITSLMIADFLMILLGYIGEVSVNQAGGGTQTGWICFLLSCVFFVYIIIVLYGQLSEAAADMPDEMRSTFESLKNFLVISWMVYPLGFMVPLLGYKGNLLALRELLYCVADIAAKVGFGIIVVNLAKKLSLHEIEQLRAKEQAQNQNEAPVNAPSEPRVQ
jgi:bacteriorhodopsin